MDEIQRFFMNHAQSVTLGKGFLKFHQFFQMLLVMGGGEGGRGEEATSPLPFIL